MLKRQASTDVIFAAETRRNRDTRTRAVQSYSDSAERKVTHHLVWMLCHVTNKSQLSYRLHLLTFSSIYFPGQGNWHRSHKDAER